MKNTTLSQIASLINAKTDSHVSIKGVCIDSRLVKPGDLFVALKGDKVDGHQFLGDVASKGAGAAIVSKEYQESRFNLPVLAVEDPLQSLQEYAKQVLAKRRSRIVAVTGSIGKTTTKEFIKTLLSAKYSVAASPGNSNSQVGLPLAILNHTTGDEEILVLEMGMTHPKNLSRLIQIAPPEVAVITTIALVHACSFDTIEDIARAKAEIFGHPSTVLGIIPREIPIYEELMSSKPPKITYSTQLQEADYYLDPKFPQQIQAHLEKCNPKISHLTVPGKHNIHNFLAAAVVARHFKLSWEEISEEMTHLCLPERRLQFVNYKGILFINDSYNASELSVKGALDTLPNPQSNGSKVAVLGSMMELGKFSDACHSRVGEFALNRVDKAYCLGEECRPIYEIFKKAGKSVELFMSRTDLVKHLQKVLKPNDVVLLKGSRSKEMWKVLDEL